CSTTFDVDYFSIFGPQSSVFSHDRGPGTEDRSPKTEERHRVRLKGVALIAGLGGGVTVHAHQQSSSRSNANPLTSQDYIEIQQLASRYAFAIDTCTHGGADFEALFVDAG